MNNLDIDDTTKDDVLLLNICGFVFVVNVVLCHTYKLFTYLAHNSIIFIIIIIVVVVIIETVVVVVVVPLICC